MNPAQEALSLIKRTPSPSILPQYGGPINKRKLFYLLSLPLEITSTIRNGEGITLEEFLLSLPYPDIPISVSLSISNVLEEVVVQEIFALHDILYLDVIRNDRMCMGNIGGVGYKEIPVSLIQWIEMERGERWVN